MPSSNGAGFREMKNEILGKEDGSSEMGLLNLGVAVDAKNNDVQTKADANPGTPESIPSVSATGYIVEISNSTGVYKTLTYDPTNASVELPVDSYTMYAHKPAVRQRQILTMVEAPLSP